MAYTILENKTFAQRLSGTIHKPLLVVFAMTFGILTVYFIPECLSITLKGICLTAGVSVPLALLVNLWALPRVFTLLARRETVLLEQKESLSPLERTELVLRVMKLPIRLTVCAVFLPYAACAALTVCLVVFLRMPLGLALSMFFTDLFACLCGGLVSYSHEEVICTREAEDLVRLGLDSDEVEKRKCFGMVLALRLLFHIVFPCAFTCVSQVLFVLCHYEYHTGTAHFLASGTALLVAQMFADIILSASFKNHAVDPTREVNELLEKMTEETNREVVHLPTDLGTELAYTFYTINELVKKLQLRVLHVDQKESAVRGFVESWSGNEAALQELLSTEQGATVKQRETLEQLNKCFEAISAGVVSASNLATEVYARIAETGALLSRNSLAMADITHANIDTIQGIKNMSTQIDQVWGFINTIDTIAGKNRTIAFNTEIESSATGENAENFHIIATEIRRLARSITESTHEIRSRITGIQHSTDNLIITSEGGTEKIREGSELFTVLDERFGEMALSGKVLDESCARIRGYIADETQKVRELLMAFETLVAGGRAFAEESATVSQTVSGISTFLKQGGAR